MIHSRSTHAALPAALLLALAAACAKDHAAAGDTTHAGATTSAVASSGAPAARCAADSLTVSPLIIDAAAGNRYLRIGLRNTGHSACTLIGFPGLVLSDSTGHVVKGIRVEHDTATHFGQSGGPTLVTVAPDSLASFDMAWGVVAGESGGCPRVGNIEVVPPDAPPSAKARGKIKIPTWLCGARARVSPVMAGNPGQG